MFLRIKRRGDSAQCMWSSEEHSGVKVFIEFLVQDGDRDLKFTLNPQSYQTYSYEKSNTL